MEKFPPTKNFREALLQLREDGIPAAHIAMLRAHYASGERGLTAQELAKAADYPNHESVNLQYGIFAGRLARALGVSASPNLDIMTIWDPQVRNKQGHLLFRMCSQLARAIESLPWLSSTVELVDQVEAITGLEGVISLQLRQHFKREKRLRGAKISAALASSRDGRLRCEVPGCGFDFEAVYGELGRHYAQVHHLESFGGNHRIRHTTLQALVVVCANCHAMIHRGGQNRPLRSLIKRRRLADA